MKRPHLLVNLVSVGLLAAALFLAPGASPPGGGVSFLVEPYLQNPTTASISIGWETSGSAASTIAFGPTPALGQIATGGSVSGSGASRIHHVRLTGLAPDSTHYYQVQSGSAVSQVIAFRTPALQAQELPFSFVAYSDTQAGNVPTKHAEVVDEGILDYYSDLTGGPIEDALDFVLVTGDLVSTGSNISHWRGDFFGQSQSLYRHVPLVPALGNHEANANLYFRYFQLPENGTTGFLEHWYWFDRGNVRIVTLDTNSGFTVQAQLDWLDTVLADACTDAGIDFVFAQMHHPHLSELWTPGESSYTTQIVQRLEQFTTSCGKPTVHFFGHTHGYSRGQSRDHSHLMVNVASGMGSVDYWYAYPQADYEEFQYSVPEWGFVVMDVEAGSDPKFHLRRVSRGNDVVFKDNAIVDQVTVRRFNNAPTTPMPLSPSLANAPVHGSNVSLMGSSYGDPDGDLALASHWQVTTAQGDYSNPVSEEWKRRENWYRPANGDSWYSVNTVSDPDITRTTLSDSLPGCTQVWWRVRYRDDGLEWSAWSDEGSFLVDDSDIGASAPVPADGASGVGFSPLLMWFPCSAGDSYDIYLGTSAALGAADLQGNQTSTSFQAPFLTPNTQYSWRIDKHVGAQITEGPTWTFTTEQTFPTPGTAEWRFNGPPTGDLEPIHPAHGTSQMTPKGMLKGTDWGFSTTGDGVVPHIAGESTGYIWLDNVIGANRGLETFFNAPGNGGGGCCDVYEFTLIWDVWVDPAETELQALWQGNATNSNDAEFFIDASNGGFFVRNTGYIGPGLWKKGQWVRIAHRVDYPTSSAVFVDGVKVLDDTQLAAADWYYGLGTNNPGWMLSDDGPATDVLRIQCANMAMVDRKMSDASIAALGGASASGIFTSLSTDISALSVATGGVQTFSLNAGVDHGLDLYLLLGTLSGTTPGLSFGGLQLPLNLDNYLLYTLVSSNAPPLSNSVSLLSPAGTGTATFTFPTNLAAGLLGLDAHHAFVVIDLATLGLSFASNAAPLQFGN